MSAGFSPSQIRGSYDMYTSEQVYTNESQSQRAYLWASCLNRAQSSLSSIYIHIYLCVYVYAYIQIFSRDGSFWTFIWKSFELRCYVRTCICFCKCRRHDQRTWRCQSHITMVRLRAMQVMFICHVWKAFCIGHAKGGYFETSKVLIKEGLTSSECWRHFFFTPFEPTKVYETFGVCNRQSYLIRSR